jgi:hypothetical protein
MFDIRDPHSFIYISLLRDLMVQHSEKGMILVATKFEEEKGRQVKDFDIRKLAHEILLDRELNWYVGSGHNSTFVLEVFSEIMRDIQIREF